MNTELTDEEITALAEDISAIHMFVINQLIAVSDKHKIGRDDLIKRFGQVFSAIAEKRTFEDMEVTK